MFHWLRLRWLTYCRLINSSVEMMQAGLGGVSGLQAGINLVQVPVLVSAGSRRQHRGPAAGGFCGDEGSAFWLGKQLIHIFTKQSDGREERTQLYDIVRDRLNLKRDFDLIRCVVRICRCGEKQLPGWH